MQLQLEIPNSLTILSFGGGQDSTAILYKIVNDPEFKQKYVDGGLIVLMADTMNEHDETYQHVFMMEKYCDMHGIFFKLIRPSDGYHTGDWTGGLIGFYEKGDRVGSKCFPKSCTDKLKIQPLYKWVDEYLHHKYGYGKRNKKGNLNKTAIREFTEYNGKINVLLGIARDEEKRASTNEESPMAWMRDCINKVYPLIEEGMNRQDCQDYITSIGMEIPLPSNCILCPFMSEQELLYLHRVMPEWFDKWVELEARKIEKNQHKGDQNMGVWGNKLLPEKLEEAKEKFGHMSIYDLREYKMSHGHCVKSKY